MREETTLIERSTLDEHMPRNGDPFAVNAPASDGLAPVDAAPAHQDDATLGNSIEVLKEMAFNLLQEVKALSHSPATDFARGIDFYDAVRRFEIDLIHRALAITDGHQSRAARLLNLKITTLNSMMKRYNIVPTVPVVVVAAATADDEPSASPSPDDAFTTHDGIEPPALAVARQQSVSLAATAATDAEPAHANAGLHHHRAA